MKSETREILKALAERYETADFIVRDPSWWMHQVSGERNQEAMAFVASGLSYGSRSQFMPKIGQLAAVGCIRRAFRHRRQRLFLPTLQQRHYEAFPRRLPCYACGLWQYG